MATPGLSRSADSRARPRRVFRGAEPMATETAKVLSVNVGGVRKFEYHGRPAQSAIWKSPVNGRVAARGVNLAGDRQADLEAHGGFDKAVYAYAVEDQRWWEREIGRPLSYGEFGENLTTKGWSSTTRSSASVGGSGARFSRFPSRESLVGGSESG